MSVQEDIAIKYTNKTGNTNFSVVVFTADIQQASDMTVAYRVLQTQNTVQFVHPKSCAVSATYETDGQLITTGPIPAVHGGKYEIVREKKTDTAIIREGMNT